MLYKRKSSKYWWVKVKRHGRTYRQSTRETSRREAAKFEERFAKSIPDPPVPFSFAAAAERWLDEKGHKRSYHSDIGILKWFAPRIGGHSLSDITRDVVEDLRKEKLKDCSPETVNRHMALLRAVLRKARDDWEWIDRIPKVPMYPKTHQPPRWLSWEDFSLIVSELPAHLKGPAWFSIATGLRAATIRHLQWSWIYRDGVRIPATSMKAGKSLSIPLSQTAWHVLAEQWGKHPTTVFVTNAGMSWQGKFTTAAWRKACERAGLPGVRFHDLRHTWASWHAQQGTPMDVLQKLGGWSTYEAMQIYAHHSPISLQKWADRGTPGGTVQKDGV